jgi:hypothetical protein
MKGRFSQLSPCNTHYPHQGAVSLGTLVQDSGDKLERHRQTKHPPWQIRITSEKRRNNIKLIMRRKHKFDNVSSKRLKKDCRLHCQCSYWVKPGPPGMTTAPPQPPEQREGRATHRVSRGTKEGCPGVSVCPAKQSRLLSPVSVAAASISKDNSQFRSERHPASFHSS